MLFFLTDHLIQLGSPIGLLCSCFQQKNLSADLMNQGLQLFEAQKSWSSGGQAPALLGAGAHMPRSAALKASPPGQARGVAVSCSLPHV